MGICLKCGGTGIRPDFTRCDCTAGKVIELPYYQNIPMQYQGVKFDRSFLPSKLHGSYGHFMEQLLKDCTDGIGTFYSNILICSPPNSGKTILAYNVYSILRSKGITIPIPMDLLEIHVEMTKYYNSNIEFLDTLSKSRLAFIKIPLDLPNKFPEIMHTIIERRVRYNGATIFLYGGSKYDLLNQDTFGKLDAIIGDGSFNSIKVYSYTLMGDEIE